MMLCILLNQSSNIWPSSSLNTETMINYAGWTIEQVAMLQLLDCLRLVIGRIDNLLWQAVEISRNSPLHLSVKLVRALILLCRRI